MIAQVKSRTKLKLRKFAPPFRAHPVHGCVYAPRGVFGATYVVETEEEYQSIEETNFHFAREQIIIICILSAIISFLGGFLQLGLAIYLAVGVATIALTLFGVHQKVKSVTRRLSFAEPRPSLRRAFRQYAYAQERAALWFLSIFFSFFAWVAWMLTHHTHGVQFYLMWFLVAFFVAGALAHSLLILLRESASAKTVASE